MTTATNFQKRVNKARKLSPVICATNGNSTKLAMASLSNPEVHYHTEVIYVGKRVVRIEETDDIGEFTRISFHLYSVTCEFPDNGNGRLNPMEKCLGNSHSGNRSDVVCYHSMAGIMKAVGEKGKMISLTDGLMSAINLLSLGGKLVKVVSTQGQGSMWGVVK